MRRSPRHLRSRALPASMVALLAIAASAVFAGGPLFVSDGTQPVPVRWDDRMFPVTFLMSSQGYVGSSISNAQLTTEITTAIANYNAITESDLQLAYGGETELNNSGNQSQLGAGIDGKNLITFNDPDLSFGPGVAAVCAQTVAAAELVVDDSNNDLDGDGTPDIPNGTYPAGTILDADIVFNAEVPLDVSGINGTADIQSLALHEIGHCVGMSHSSVRDAVMFPFQSNDVASTRQLKADDVAHVADQYPLSPDYETGYGAIEGQVLSGVTGRPVVGAHVFAEDAVARTVEIGAYTGTDGRYRLPVPAGDYVVGIEPLDGDPAGLDPERINTVIQNTTDVLFPEEYYDANESSTDTPQDVEVVPVAAGIVNSGVDITTNTLDVISSSLLIGRGMNLLAYPVSVPPGITAYGLLTELSQNADVNSIQRLNTLTGRFETAHLVDGVPSGYDFVLDRSSGYIVHSGDDDLLRFSGSPDCPAFDLAAGTNLIGAPCAPAEYSAFDLLKDLGSELDVTSVQAYDNVTDTWVIASYSGADPSGVDFPVVDGGAYLVDLIFPISGFRINGSDSEFPPLLLSASPGQAIRGGIVTLKGTGFAEDPTQNVVLFNESAGEILSATTQQIVVKVPVAASSGTVQVLSLGLPSNALPFDVLESSINEIEGQVNDIANGQTISGTLSDELDSDDYRFLAIEGNRITARVVTQTPGMPELKVSLLNPLGGALTVAGNGNGTVATIRSYPAPETGFYTINIQSLAGSGPYSLELYLEGVPGEPRLVAISGDYQTGVSGTQLPEPMQIVAVDESGLPASGVPISFAVNPVGQQSSATLAASRTVDATRAMTSGDMTTLTSGILTVDVQLPDEETGDFEITVTAPFRSSSPVTLLVSAIPKPIATVEMTPATKYACEDGSGCVVGEEVDIPYELVFKDIDGDAIEGVFTEFGVASGEGKVAKTSGGPWEDTVRVESDSSGTVTVFHQLGTNMFFAPIAGTNNPTNPSVNPYDRRLPMPQQVVAGIPGQPLPAVFEATPKAAAPSFIRSLRAQNQRASVGAASYGLFAFLVTDQFGNPVVNEPLAVNSYPPGIFIVPGRINGQPFFQLDTDENGMWSIGLGINDDGSLASPTINEFREVLLPPIPITYSIGAASITYLLDIDMGPYTFTNALNSSALIGKTIDDGLEITVRRIQREDTFIYAGDVDEDGGHWEDETFENLRDVLINVPVTISPRRLDGNEGKMAGNMPNPIPTTKLYDDQSFTWGDIWSGDTGPDGKLTLPRVRAGGLFGGVNLLVDIGTQDLEFYTDPAPNQDPDPYRVEPFEFPQGVVPIYIDPLIIQVDIEDMLPGSDPDAPRKYPGLGLASGIDVGRLGISVNNSEMLGAALVSLSTFPNFATLTYDDVQVSSLDLGDENLRPEKLRLIYYPSSDQLMGGDSNTIVIQLFFDDVGHRGEAKNPSDDTDSSDSTVTFEFSY